MLNDDTLLARYAFQSSDVRSDGNPHAKLFKGKRGEPLSVYDITGMQHSDVCDFGHIYADNPQKGRRHFGYARIFYRVIADAGLGAEYDNTPPRHVSILFSGPEENVREICKMLAALSDFRQCTLDTRQ